jgi:hypothetical protein
MSDPFVPAVQSLWWVQTTILPPGDPGDQRLAAVLVAPPTTQGTVAVVLRTGPDGGFSWRVPVQCRLWTGSNVTPTGRLDDATFAALQTRFNP